MHILNCPFCNGWSDVVIYRIDNKTNGVCVQCTNCGASSQKFLYKHIDNFQENLKLYDKCKKQSTEMWNKRYQIKEIQT